MARAPRAAPASPARLAFIANTLDVIHADGPIVEKPAHAVDRVPFGKKSHVQGLGAIVEERLAILEIDARKGQGRRGSVIRHDDSNVPIFDDLTFPFGDTC